MRKTGKLGFQQKVLHLSNDYSFLQEVKDFLAL